MKNKMVLKIDGRYHICNIKNRKAVLLNEFYERLKDIKEVYRISSISTYLKDIGIDAEEIQKKHLSLKKKLMKEISTYDGDAVIYVVLDDEKIIDDLPKERTKFEITEEKKWWKTLNEKCLGCKKTCKQSSKVTVVICPLFEKL
jgi:hypothetical protein